MNKINAECNNKKSELKRIRISARLARQNRCCILPFIYSFSVQYFQSSFIIIIIIFCFVLLFFRSRRVGQIMRAMKIKKTGKCYYSNIFKGIVRKKTGNIIDHLFSN